MDAARASESPGPPAGAGPARAYLYIEQLAALTPWTPAAIRTLIARGEFQEGLHFFKPHGPGSRPIFKLRAVIDYIEGAAGRSRGRETIRCADGTEIDLDDATTDATRLQR